MNHISSGQYLQIQAVARTLHDSDVFKSSVLTALSQYRRPVSNDEVTAAISHALGSTPVYFTDASPSDTAPTKKGKTMTTNTTRKYKRLSSG